MLAEERSGKVACKRMGFGFAVIALAALLEARLRLRRRSASRWGRAEGPTGRCPHRRRGGGGASGEGAGVKRLIRDFPDNASWLPR